MSPGTVCCAEKQENFFWFSSLGQMIQFDSIKYHRTFVELFWISSCGLKKKESL